jgi:hypothetical protein
MKYEMALFLCACKALQSLLQHFPLLIISNAPRETGKGARAGC